MYGRLKKFGKWGELHEESELLAMEAERLKGIDHKRAREVSIRAAKTEEECLKYVPWEATNVGVRQREFCESLVASAAALYFKSGDYASAQRVIDSYSEKVTSPHPKMRLDEVVEALTEIN